MNTVHAHAVVQSHKAALGCAPRVAGSRRSPLRSHFKACQAFAQGDKAMSVSPFSTSAHPTTHPINSNNGMPLPVINNTVPSDRALELWQKAEAVCFDVDCTITVNDSLDLLAEFMGVGEEVKALTDLAMNGTIDLNKSIEERLKVINCKPEDLRNFIIAHPPQSRLTKGIETLIKALQARGVRVYLISGGFRKLILPIASHLGVPPEDVIANRMLWQWDDETETPSRLVGFDMSEPTAHQQGKPLAIARIREQSDYSSVVMIGDGITDLEAIEGADGADLFIGYGGVVERPQVKESADWYVTDFDVLRSSMAEPEDVENGLSSDEVQELQGWKQDHPLLAAVQRFFRNEVEPSKYAVAPATASASNKGN